MANRALEMLDKAGYIPPKSSWTPPDKALYGVKELFRLPEDKVTELQFQTIK